MEEAAKAAPATVDLVTPSTAVDVGTPVSDSGGHGDVHLAVAQGYGRLSALTVHQPTRQRTHRRRRLHLQQEIPLWQEKYQDKVQLTGRMLR